MLGPFQVAASIRTRVVASDDLRARAAHHAGDRRRPVGVVDHHHVGVEAAHHAVERLDLLAVLRAADDQPPAGDAVAVEGVQRLARSGASRSW